MLGLEIKHACNVCYVLCYPGNRGGQGSPGTATLRNYVTIITIITPQTQGLSPSPPEISIGPIGYNLDLSFETGVKIRISMLFYHFKH